ncbi:energy-dependent translational throttle protein EttA, partial [Bacillus atrophaeus ATCC 9372]
LLAFPGSAIVISHARWFLDRVATHILDYEGDSKAVFFEGNYSEYAEDFKKRFGKDHQPERIKYKRIG